MKTLVKNSSNVAWVDFNEDTQTMEVTYKAGVTYQYDKVPVQDGRLIEATAHMDKISTGQLVNRFLKQPKLPYKKL